METPCYATENPAFTNPEGADEQSRHEAIRACESCPVRKQCAKEALTAGASPIDDHRLPAIGVIQAGVVCRGNLKTAQALAAIAGVKVPTKEDFMPPRNNAADQCINCESPMVPWSRNDPPEGYVMHYARQYCTECRSAYQKAYPPKARRRLRRAPRNRKKLSST